MAARAQSTLLRLVPIFLGLLGMLLVLVAGALAGRFMGWHFALGGVSILSLAGGLFWLQDPRWRESLASLTYTSFFALSLALVYLIAANRPTRLDLTTDRVHTLSPLTMALLRMIPETDRIVVQLFVPTADHAACERFFSAYRRASSRVAFEVYDPARDLDVVQRFQGTIAKGKMFVVRFNGEGVPTARTDGELMIGGINREFTMTNAIARTLQGEQQSIYWVVGHGERGFVADEPDSYAKLGVRIEENALPVKGLRLMEGPVPADAAAVVLAGPKSDLQDFEREVLTSYLDGGGKLLLLIDPALARDPLLPNVEAVARHAGIEAVNNLVVDPDALNSAGSYFSPRVGFSQHPIAKGTNRQPFTMPLARPLIAAESVANGIKLSGLLGTVNDQCWSEDAAAPRSIRSLVPPTDPKELGQQLMALASERTIEAGKYGSTMRVVVIGDTDAFQNSDIERAPDAMLLILQSLNWMREREALLNIPPKLLAHTPISLGESSLYVFGGGFLLLGLLISLGGTAYSVARRRAR